MRVVALEQAQEGERPVCLLLLLVADLLAGLLWSAVLHTAGEERRWGEEGGTQGGTCTQEVRDEKCEMVFVHLSMKPYWVLRQCECGGGLSAHDAFFAEGVHP